MECEHFSAHSRSPSCVNGQLLTWQVVTAERASCNRHLIVKKMPLSFSWHAEKESFILNRSNQRFLNAEPVCSVYKSVTRESVKKNFKPFPKDVFGKYVSPISKVCSLCFPIYFIYLENTRQTSTLKIQHNPPRGKRNMKDEAPPAFTAHLKVMQVKNMRPRHLPCLCQLSYICTVNIRTYTLCCKLVCSPVCFLRCSAERQVVSRPQNCSGTQGPRLVGIINRFQ